MKPTDKEVQKAIKFWHKTSKENFQTAKIMHKAKRYNFAMFMCQQAIEALLKGVYIIKHRERPPYIHDLPRLVEKIKMKIPQKIIQPIKNIDSHYIKARYKEDRFNPEIYNHNNSTETIKITYKVIKWYLQKLKLKI